MAAGRLTRALGSTNENPVANLNIDTAAAEAYEESLVPGIFGPWAEDLVAGAGIVPGMYVLDLACGTGVAARYAAHLCSPNGRVFGIDIDSGMIEIAKRAVTLQLGLGGDFYCAPADNLPIDTASIDLALCFQGLQFFPDRLKAFSELHRVVKPRGRVIATTWNSIDSCKGHWAMVRALENRSIETTAARKPFSLSDGVILGELAERAGFRDVTVRTNRRLADFSSTESFVNAIAQGAPSSRLALAKVPKADWPMFLSEVDAALSSWKSGSRLLIPMESNILEAMR